jgi:putative inorganic carbon (hco3(-)) transporter
VLGPRLSIERRYVALAACALVVVCLGAVTGRSPLIGVGIAIALAATAVVASNLELGIIVFAIASFANDLPLSSVATAGKAVGFLLLVGWAAVVGTGGQRDRRGLLADHQGVVIFCLLFLCWNVLSATWAQSPSTALSGSSRYAMNVALFPIVYTGIRDLRSVRRVAIAFVAGAVLSIAYGTLAGTAIAGDPSRLAGALGDPNETAMALVAAAVLAFALAGGARSRPAKFAAIACGLGSLGALVDTGSRGGLVALVVAVATGIALADRYRGRALVAALVTMAMGVGFFLAVAPSGSSHITSGGGSDGRSTLWTLAVRAIEAHPIQGLGNDNFQDDAGEFLVEPGYTDSAGLVIDTPHVAHNIYLEMWADIGIVGLLLFLALVAACVRCNLRAIQALKQAGRQADELIARGVLVATVGMLAADFFISDIFSKQLWLMLAIAPALANVARRASEDETTDLSTPPLIAGPVLLAAAQLPPPPVRAAS